MYRVENDRVARGELGMRNTKLLWGLIGFLLIVVAALGFEVIRLTRERITDPNHPLPPPSPSAMSDGVVAKIGDVEIRSSALQQQLLHKYGAEMINQMLDREAIRMEADDLGMKIGRDEIDRELKRMQQGYDSEQQFYESMKTQLGMTKDEIREDVYYKLLLEKIATRNINVSEQDIDAYIKAHPEEFGKIQLLRIQIIVNASKDQAARTIELYQSGRDFAQLAKERSLDTATANDGGDLGWVEENDPFVPAEIMNAAKSLKAGEISGPIETAEGYAVVRLKDRKEQVKGDNGDIRETVRKQLLLQQAPPLPEVVKSLRGKRNAVILDPQLQL